MKNYDHQKIEKKWLEIWSKTKLYEVDLASKPKFYSLVMFPYPSGNLHIGHWYNFSPADTFSRFKRMTGHNVLNPIGFDAFGLPAENAAIKRNINPRQWTYDNIAKMTDQLKAMGPSYDWSRVLVTSDPEYYRWTQWMFLLMYEKGLAYKKKAMANWCPSCNTILANEQVVAGKCERCDSEVIQREIDHWLFRITDYADRLLAGLKKLDWPEKTKAMQRNWIGKSEGALIQFSVADSKFAIEVFTTRADTLYGATYLVLAPEHPILNKIVTQELKKNITEYQQKVSKETELERISQEKIKSGVFTGAYAINPATEEKIPIWISDYVLSSYGTGAIMAVPAHDERDQEFAQKFNLKIKEVVLHHRVDVKNPPKNGKKTSERQAIHGIVYNPKTDKYLCLKWKEFPWTTFIVGGVEEEDSGDIVAAAKREIYEETGYKSLKLIRILGSQVVSEYYAAHKDVNRKAYVNAVLFELEDEQRDEPNETEKAKHKAIWLNRNDITQERMTCAELDLWMDWIDQRQTVLTEEGITVNSGVYNGLRTEETRRKVISDLAKKGIAKKKIQYKLRDWTISRQRYWGAPIPIVICPKCGNVPVPEKELPIVLPEIESFKPTGESPLKNNKDFTKTTCPKCGGPAERETDTMDTFLCSSWYYLRYLDPKNDKQFASQKVLKDWLPVDMYIGGAEHSVLHLLYSRFFAKVLFDAGYITVDEPFQALRHQGTILGPDNQKMSKSRGNVVDPDDLVKSYGADSVRMFIEFMGPYDLGGPWQSGGIQGISKFLLRIWNLVQKNLIEESVEDIETERILAKTTKKVTEDLAELKFNTAISSLMVLTNFLQKKPQISKKTMLAFVRLLAPFAPFMAEEIWSNVLHEEGSVHFQSWPEYDRDLIQDDLIAIAIQINGKVRGQIVVSPEATQEEILTEAKKSENINKYLVKAKIKKIIYIKGKILSIVA